MDSRDHMSRSASTACDQDDNPAEEHLRLATRCLRVLTILFGLFVLLPLVLFSPFVLLIYAGLSQVKDQLVLEMPDDEPELIRHHADAIPAPVEELGVELIAG